MAPSAPNSGTGQGLRIFLSYGHDANTPVVELLRADLETAGYSTWIDTSEIKAGEDWRESIVRGIDGSSSVLAFLSKHSVRDPGVCRDELRIAMGWRSLHVNTVLLEDEANASPPAPLAHRQWLDMSTWREHWAAGGNDWRRWYEHKRDELLTMVSSGEPAKLHGEITSLRARLNPPSDAGRDALIAGKKLMRRPWIHDRIERWRTMSTKRVLVIFGGAGTGKSVVATTELFDNPSAISGVFCEWGQRSRSAPALLTRQVAFNLATKIPDYRRSLLSVLEQLSDARINAMSTREMLGTLVTTPLRECPDGGRDAVFVIIDALDEADRSTGRFADDLRHEAELWPRWARLLVTSRSDPDTVLAFENSETIDLDQESDQQEHDIATFVAASVRDLEIGGKHRTLEIIRAAGHSFLVASLLLDHLAVNPLSPIPALPMGVGPYYRDMIQRATSIADVPSDDVLDLLEILVVHPYLPTETLADALRTTRRRIRRLLRSLSGLVRIDDTRPSEPDAVSLFHATLAQWLMNQSATSPYAVDRTAGASKLVDVILDRAAALDHSRRPMAHNPLVHETGRLFSESERWADYINYLKRAYRELPYWTHADRIPAHHDPASLVPYFRELTDRPWREISAGRYERSAPQLAGPWLVASRWQPSSFTIATVSQMTVAHPLSGFMRSAASDVVVPWKERVAEAAMRIVRRHAAKGIVMPRQVVDELQRIVLCATWVNGTPDYDRLFTERWDDSFLRRGFCELLPRSDSDDWVNDARRAFNTACIAARLDPVGHDFIPPSPSEVLQLVAHGGELQRALECVTRALGARRGATVPGASMDARNFVSEVRNHLSSDPRWHPKASVFVRNLDARADYATLEQFPCCGAWAPHDVYPAGQYDIRGCQPAPPQFASKVLSMPKPG